MYVKNHLENEYDHHQSKLIQHKKREKANKNKIKPIKPTKQYDAQMWIYTLQCKL